jgi:prevent-host-death family protein
MLLVCFKEVLMTFSVTEDIRSITDLKRNTTDILSRVHSTGRPVVLTVNGKAEAVLLDAKEFDKISSAFNMLQLLMPSEEDVKHGRTKNIKTFFNEFRHAKKIQG